MRRFVAFPALLALLLLGCDAKAEGKEIIEAVKLAVSSEVESKCPLEHYPISVCLMLNPATPVWWHQLELPTALWRAGVTLDGAWETLSNYATDATVYVHEYHDDSYEYVSLILEYDWGGIFLEFYGMPRR